MAKHTLYRATFTAAEVEVPDACPKCGAAFHVEGSLIEGNWVDCTVRSHLTGPTETEKPEVTPEGYTDYGDEYRPVGLMCSACDWLLEPPKA